MFDKVETPNDLKTFVLQTLIIVLVALPMGFLDMKLQNTRNNKKLSKLKRVFLILFEIMVSIIYVYLIMKNIPYVADTFQTTLPGMFFPGVFYSLQTNMFGDIIALYRETF